MYTTICLILFVNLNEMFLIKILTKITNLVFLQHLLILILWIETACEMPKIYFSYSNIKHVKYDIFSMSLCNFNR